MTTTVPDEKTPEEHNHQQQQQQQPDAQQVEVQELQAEGQRLRKKLKRGIKQGKTSANSSPSTSPADSRKGSAVSKSTTMVIPDDPSKTLKGTRKLSKTKNRGSTTKSVDTTKTTKVIPKQNGNIGTKLVKVLYALYPRIPKVTAILLQRFIKTESKVVLQRLPFAHFCQEQLILSAQDCTNKFNRKIINNLDFRDIFQNLASLHQMSITRYPETSKDLETKIRKQVLILGEVCTALEKLADLQITDYMQLCNIIYHKTQSIELEKLNPYTYYIPKTSDFRAIKLLGAGGFGAVYKAEYIPASLVVTIKFVSIDRFSKHKQACIDKVVASVISTPFIVRYYCCFSVREAYVTMMEYINGVDLMRVVTKAVYLNNEQSKYVTAQLILALEHLHLCGFLHRDIKVSNMLIIPGGHVKTIDFDTNKICFGHFSKRPIRGFFSRTACEFHDGESAGTIPYMSPEILKRRPYGRACDWWSAGIVLYKIVTGKVPFRGKTKQQLRDRIIGSPLKWPKFESMPHSGNIRNKDLCYKLLIKDPKKRIGSKNYALIKAHPYFENFNWKLPNLKYLFEVPALLEVMTVKKPDAEEDPQNPVALTVEASTNTKKRTLQKLEDMKDMELDQHKALYTYASKPYKNLVENLKNSVKITTAAAILDNDLAINESTTSNMAAVPLLYGNENYIRNPNLIDVILFRRKALSEPWAYGIGIEPVNGPKDKWLIINNIKKKSAAHRSNLTVGDILVAVNGQPLINLSASSTLELIENSDKEVILTVYGNNPFRIINGTKELIALVKNCPRERLTLQSTRRIASPIGTSFGFTVVSRKAYNEGVQGLYYRFHLIMHVDHLLIAGESKNIYPGDLITHIDEEPTALMSKNKLLERLNPKKGDVKIYVTIVMSSPLRQKDESTGHRSFHNRMQQ